MTTDDFVDFLLEYSSYGLVKTDGDESDKLEGDDVLDDEDDNLLGAEDKLLSDEDYMEEVKVFIDRLLMRIFDAVSLMQHLDQVSVIKKDDVQVVQLVFATIPDETIQDLQRIVGTESMVYKFKKEGTPFVGVEVPLPPELFKKDSSPVVISA